MTDEHDKRRSPLAVWLIALAVSFPPVYVLSTGPVIKAARARQVDQLVVSVVYWPLEKLYDNCPPVAAFFDWYLGLWGLR